MINEPSWAKPAISILMLLVFVILIGVAMYSDDKTSLAILSGVGASMAQQVAGYYLGSSSGSAAKTTLLSSTTDQLHASMVERMSIAPDQIMPSMQTAVETTASQSPAQNPHP